MPPSRKCIGTRAVADLPLNGRDPMMLAITTPGVLLGTSRRMTGMPPGEDFVGAGTREIQNSMSLDGISIMNNLITTTPTRPMVETVQEVEVQTGTYSAQYGAYMGVHINMVTKSGTNQFHGTRWSSCATRCSMPGTFFTCRRRRTRPRKPPLRQNQFGVRVRWAVVIPKLYNGRDKTFFMASYEGFRTSSSRPRSPRKCRRRSSPAISRACPPAASPAAPLRIR